MLHKGEVIAELHGPAAALLSGERVVLNLIQRLSGIATMTREAVRCLDDEQIKICDTRKQHRGSECWRNMLSEPAAGIIIDSVCMTAS